MVLVSYIHPYSHSVAQQWATAPTVPINVRCEMNEADKTYSSLAKPAIR